MKSGFVVVNNIKPLPSYIKRMEELFCSRKREIDRVPGFRFARVLKPRSPKEAYLVISEWADEESFKNWTKSEEFAKGHQRAFEDMKKSKEMGENLPMESQFKIYDILTD